jgi:hypothetical protein
MVFTFHYPYVILKLVSSTEFSGQRSDADTKAKLLKQGYVAPRLMSSLQKFYDRHHILVNRYEISLSQVTMNLLLFT